MKQLSFSRFEAIARKLVEGSFRRLFGEQLEAVEIASHLARALDESQMAGHVADTFYLQLQPEVYASLLRSRPSLAADLADYVSELARQGGLQLVNRPLVELTPDTRVRAHEVFVRAEQRSPEAGADTQIYARPATGSQSLKALTQLDAFLILEGKRHVPLDKPIMTLGRRTNNDIILDRASVSRLHAQIRWRYGRFVLYDLSRRGRTRVNSEAVVEHALEPGDVIALSDVLIIYGEGREHRIVSSDTSDGDNEPTWVKSASGRRTEFRPGHDDLDGPD